MRYVMSVAAVAGIAASAAVAGPVNIEFGANPTIEPGANDMMTLSNGAVYGRAQDGNDRVRYADVATVDGVRLDAILSVVDATNRTGIAFTGGSTLVSQQAALGNTAIVNLTNKPSSGRFGGAGQFDADTGLQPTAGSASDFQRTSAIMRLDFVNAGTSTRFSPGMDVALTFFDIDGSGSRRGRVEGLTLFNADSVAVTADTVLVQDTSTPGAVTLTPSTGMRQAPDSQLMRHSVTATWRDTSSVEFEWFFDWTATGTRGVQFSGSTDAIIPMPAAAAVLGVGGLVGCRRRRA